MAMCKTASFVKSSIRKNKTSYKRIRTTTDNFQKGHSLCNSPIFPIKRKVNLTKMVDHYIDLYEIDLISCDPGFLMAIICRVHVPEAPSNFQFFTAPSSPGSQWPSASNFSCLANSYKHFMLRPWPKESMKIPQQSKTDEIQPSWVYSLFCS